MTFKGFTFPQKGPLIDKLNDPDCEGTISYLQVIRYNGMVIVCDANGAILTQDEFETLVDYWGSLYDKVTHEEIVTQNKQKREALLSSPVPQQPEVEKQKQQGYVYLIGGGGFYKIGKAINLDRRLNQISPKLPFEVSLIHSIETDDISEMEEAFHEMFAPKRANGEWFRLNQEDIDYLKSF